jgi:hypothetical protein
MDELLKKKSHHLIQENVCGFWIDALRLSDKFKRNVAVIDDFSRTVLRRKGRISLYQEVGQPKEGNHKIRRYCGVSVKNCEIHGL